MTRSLTAPRALEHREAAVLGRRYGIDQPQPPAWNTTIESILGHHTVRAYLPEPLPDGVLELAVAAAQSAPSSSNLQAWSVVAVEDPARRARLEALAGPNPQINEAPLLLVWLADLSRLRRNSERLGQPSAGLDFVESLLLAAIDAGLAAQNAVVALESLGFGTCYIGAIRNNPEAVAAELKLPPGTVALFGLTVGRADPSRPAAVKPRLARDAVLHREAYATADEPDLVADYDAVLRAFQKRQGLPAHGWATVAATRVAGASALKGRDRLADALRALGFNLS